jgi:hypothetical protein
VVTTCNVTHLPIGSKGCRRPTMVHSSAEMRILIPLGPANEIICLQYGDASVRRKLPAPLSSL